MSEAHTITSLGATWQPGDVVLTSKGELRVRASNNPVFPWGDPSQILWGGFGETHFEGGYADEDTDRPLTLLVRNGVPVGGLVINEGDTPAID
ncbi:hypothetical protein [Streptomyces iranensis]|uniref:Uncharacterized protein n=1 Tax=Streptomyces iranensis TaxID=576784 RepID=A0A061A9I8_9ACTN|nr:hypothetical protein [Streptomyces iranensis]MBP2059741.1 hypothetical protein [Streptomyces iranensis]CDR15074.1 predicted protein [Streptomyces iranensis]